MRLALVLEGGALRGVYTAGVLDVLLEHKIEVDMIVGVSAGALNTMSYLSKQKGRSAKINIENCDNPRYIGTKAMLKNKGVIGFDYLFGEISHTLYPFDYEAFENASEIFYAVATNCITGEATYFEKGKDIDIYKAIEASASLPLAARMVEIDNTPYLDGAVADSVPVKWTLDQGYDKVIVVLTRDKTYRKPECSMKTRKLYQIAYKKYPKLLEKLYTMPERYNALQEEIEKLAQEKKIYVVRPKNPVLVGRLEKDRTKLQALYEEAIEQTNQEWNAIKTYLYS